MRGILFVATLAGSFTASAAPLKPIVHGCFFQGVITDASGKGTITCFSKTGEVSSDEAATVVLQGVTDVASKPIFVEVSSAGSIDQVGGEYLMANSDIGPVGTRVDGATAKVTIPDSNMIGVTVGIYPSDANSTNQDIEQVVYRRGLAGPGYYHRGGYYGHPIARGAVVGGAVVGGAYYGRRNWCYYHPYRCY